MKQTIVWTIAGSDSSGGAGIQADLKTFHALGVHGASVITAITAQNAREISHIQYASSQSIESQLTMLSQFSLPKAIKIGMVGGSVTINILINFLMQYTGHVIVDPLIQSSSHKNLFPDNDQIHLTQLKRLFPFVTLLTPNIQEAEKLLGRHLRSYQDIEEAAKDFIALGVKNVLIKGGHITDTLFSQDYWTDGKESAWLVNKRLENRYYRGTGCVLSAAVTACLGLDYSIKDALVIAKMYTHQCIRLSEIRDHHAVLLSHSSWPENQQDLPYFCSSPLYALPENGVPKQKIELGLYPVVDSLHWLKKLLPLGIKTLQLRIKNKIGIELEQEIEESIALAAHYKANLFINDYWQLAIRHQAYGVHLGQEDLNKADVAAIKHANIKLGVSTHCYYEVARAHAFHPWYLACGPIFPTQSKIMPFAPQGITQLQRWRKTLHYPLVAIGGINHENISQIIESKVEGIAMISAITHAKDPIHAANELLKRTNQHAIA